MSIFSERIINSVVAIGKPEKEDFTAFATGFFFGHLTPDPQKQGDVTLTLFLVTNQHVIDGLHAVGVRINDKSGQGSKVYELPLFSNGGQRFFEENKAIDLAVISVQLTPWSNQELGPTLIITPESLFSVDQFTRIGVSEADSVFVLGYPMGLIDVNKNFPFVRMGIVSRIGDFLAGHSDSIIIDSQIYPGNSGGPVFLEPRPYIDDVWKPPIYPIGTPFPYLMGVVSGYIPYKETAYSIQTGKPRIEFQENSGLARVIPSSFIIDLINKHIDYRISIGARLIAHPFPNS